MTPKDLREAAQRVVENGVQGTYAKYYSVPPADFEALREALEQPMAWKECAFCGMEHQIKSDGYILDVKTDEVFCRKCYIHTHERQEPVGNRIVGNDKDGYTIENLYTAPQPVKEGELTDDEIDALVDSACESQMPMDMFARAVIAAYKEKQRG